MDTSGTPSNFQTVLRGANMRPKEDREALDAELAPGIRFELVRDRFNSYDMFAVKVMYNTLQSDGPPHFVGFIHRDTALYVGQWMDAGWSFSCRLEEIDDVSKKREHVLLIVPIEKGEAYVEPKVSHEPPANEHPHLDMDDDIPF